MTLGVGAESTTSAACIVQDLAQIGSAERSRLGAETTVFTTATGRVALTDLMPVGRQVAADARDDVRRNAPNGVVLCAAEIDAESGAFLGIFSPGVHRSSP